MGEQLPIKRGGWGDSLITTLVCYNLSPDFKLLVSVAMRLNKFQRDFMWLGLVKLFCFFMYMEVMKDSLPS